MIATRPLGLRAQRYSTKAQGFIQQTFALDHTPSSEVQQNFKPSHSSIYPVHHPEHEQTKKKSIFPKVFYSSSSIFLWHMLPKTYYILVGKKDACSYLKFGVWLKITLMKVRY